MLRSEPGTLSGIYGWFPHRVGIRYLAEKGRPELSGNAWQVVPVAPQVASETHNLIRPDVSYPEFRFLAREFVWACPVGTENLKQDSGHLEGDGSRTGRWLSQKPLKGENVGVTVDLFDVISRKSLKRYLTFVGIL